MWDIQGHSSDVYYMLEQSDVCMKRPMVHGLSVRK